MSLETSNRVRFCAPRILDLWEEQAYHNVLSSFGITSLLLKNAIHSFLDNIADVLATTDPLNARELRNNSNILTFAKVHGGGRAVEPFHYTLAEVILEFQIMERVIFEVLEETAPIPIADRRAISKTIDQALSAAATQFAVVHQQIQEQYALMMVHDFRSPINVVKMGSQIIQRDLLASKESVEIAAKISKHMDRLEAMLKELLDVSRVRAGMGVGFAFEIFDLNQLVKEVAMELKGTYGERFDLPSDKPVLGRWNLAGIRRVAENLMINAFKYGSPDTRVRVSVTQTETHAMLSVHNAGNPIAVDERSRLFEKFTRGAGSITQTGWGLGLALVGGMVTAHRGSVRIESTPANGTDFIVELPKKP